MQARSVFAHAVVVGLAAAGVCLAQTNGCADLRGLVQSTYNFKPSRLNEAQKAQKASEMDRVWSLVQSRPAEMLPCLMAQMEEPGADRWFLFDAGALLIRLDRSARSRALLLRGCEEVDLDDVQLEDWMRRLTSLALEDLDISAAAARWMRYPRASFTIVQHAFTVNRAEGAFFLYGSMDEKYAAPALLKIAADPTHAERELALSLLAGLATPEADADFRSVNLSGLSPQAQNAARTAL